MATRRPKRPAPKAPKRSAKSAAPKRKRAAPKRTKRPLTPPEKRRSKPKARSRAVTKKRTARATQASRKPVARKTPSTRRKARKPPVTSKRREARKPPVTSKRREARKPPVTSKRRKASKPVVRLQRPVVRRGSAQNARAAVAPVVDKVLATAPPEPAARALPSGVRVGRMPARSGAVGASPAAPPDVWRAIDAAGARLSSDQRALIGCAIDRRDAVLFSNAPADLLLGSELLATVLGWSVIVVQPHAALARDAHQRLVQRRVAATLFEPELAPGARLRSLEQLRQSGGRIVFTTPSELERPDVCEALRRAAVRLVVLEHAHAASELGHDFKPGYAALHGALSRIGRPPVALVSHAATGPVRQHVAQIFGLRAPITAQTPVIRDNVTLELCAAPAASRDAMLVRLLGALPRPGIVLCSSPRNVNRIWERLRNERIPAHRCHAELPAGERLGEQLAFCATGERAVMVATSAFAPAARAGGEATANGGFGLGVQKRDLRFVVHFDVPASLEQYVSDLDLIARDGSPGSAILLYDQAAIGARSTGPLPRHDAELVLRLAEALEPYAVEGGTVSSESLALALRASERAVTGAIAQLRDTGLVALSGGWVRPRAAGTELRARALCLARQLDTVTDKDVRRASAVVEYVSSTTCRGAALARYFAAEARGACGRCDTCRVPAERRVPPRGFSVAESSRTFSADTGENTPPLTAKLGDFFAA